jgi:WD40 repeat protein
MRSIRFWPILCVLFFLMGYGHFICAQTVSEATLMLQVNHSASITQVVFSMPDGRFMATGDNKGTVKIWEPNQRLIIQNLQVAGSVTALSFSPSGDTLLVESETGSRERILTLFEWASGSTISTSKPDDLEWLITDFHAGIHYFREFATGTSILSFTLDFIPKDSVLFDGVSRFYCRAVARAHHSLTVALGYESGLVELLDLRTMKMITAPSDTFGYREFIRYGKLESKKTPDAMAVKTLRFSETDKFLISSFEQSDPDGKLILNFTRNKTGKIVVWRLGHPIRNELTIVPFKYDLQDVLLLESTEEILARGCDENIMVSKDSDPCLLKCFSLKEAKAPKWEEFMDYNSAFYLSPQEQLLIGTPKYDKGMDWYEPLRKLFETIGPSKIQPYIGSLFFHPKLPRVCLEMPDYGWDLGTWKKIKSQQPIYHDEGLPVGEIGWRNDTVACFYSTFNPVIEGSLKQKLTNSNPDTFSKRFQLVLFKELKKGLRPVDTLVLPHRLSNPGAGFPSLSSTGAYFSLNRDEQTTTIYGIHRKDTTEKTADWFANGRHHYIKKILSIIRKGEMRVNNLLFTPDDHFLIVDMDNQYTPGGIIEFKMGTLDDFKPSRHILVVYDLNNGNQKYAIPLNGLYPFKLTATADKLILLDQRYEGETTGSEIRIYNLRTHGKLVDSLSFKFPITGVFPDKEGLFMALVKTGNEILLYDQRQKKILHSLKHNMGVVKDVQYKNDLSLLAIVGEGKAELWNTDKGTLLVTIVFFEEGALVYTPDGYYMSSSTLLTRYLSFRQGKSVWPIQQFDLNLNRPDIVLERMGVANPATLSSYKAVVQKRLKKNAVAVFPTMPDELVMPEVNIVNRPSLPYLVEEDQQTLKLEIRSTTAPVVKLLVWINGNPVSTMANEKELFSASSIDTTHVTLELSPGYNWVEVQAEDVSGRKSGISMINFYNQIEYLPDLYLMLIGLSEYQNGALLPGPEEDVRLLSKIYADSALCYVKKTSGKRSPGIMYRKIEEVRLLNKEVTREKLDSLQIFLSKARTGDHVIFYFAGHGILKDSSHYYLTTWDTDFQHPELRGIEYDTLLQSFSTCKARQKLFLINACNAGEFDADMAQFNLMKGLFPDIRSNNGAQVLVGATGNQSAFSSSDETKCLTPFGWFYSDFLINFNPADDAVNPRDLNYDNYCSVSECAAYLSRHIAAVTDGDQQPELRQYNFNADFNLSKRKLKLVQKISLCKK